MSVIGHRIKKLREQRNWSQLTLSKKIGINNSVLSRIEAGKRNVEDDLITKFVELFEVTSDYLLGYTDNPDKTVTNKLDNIDESEWPEAYNVLRRANKKLTDKEKRKMLRLIEELFLDDEEEEQKDGKADEGGTGKS
ncbi:helix-turn-helix transcriptional regulator [Pseudalkalibacillus sp. SCS-8]|uniref:helix-turn-helix domain-containing protein n=1 Tax=Pseudalkalibacillus nanhaiensis TaxID=3115291 RepID=UPI0032D9B54C